MKGASLIAPFGLRMPEELKRKVAERAKANGRSMNAEIVQIIQDAVNIPTESELDEVISHLNISEHSDPERESYLKQMEMDDPLKAKVLRLSDSFSENLLRMMKDASDKRS